MNYIIYTDYSVCSPTIISESGFSPVDEPLETFEANDFREVYEELLARNQYGKVPAIICTPLKEAAITFVGTDLRSLQRAVGGNIEIISIPEFPGVDIICNEDGKVNKMHLNRGLMYKDKIYDVVAGPMIILGVTSEGKNVGLDMKTMEKLYYRFLEPEVFIIDKNRNQITSVKCSPDTAEIMRENNISIIG